MALDVVTLAAAKKYTDEQIEKTNVSGGGLTSQEKADLEKNTEARHIHSNKDILDYFGINYAKTRPTFKSSNGLDNILATQEDLSSRIASLRNILENQISTIPKFSIKVVDTLPTENISNMTVYLLKDTETDGNLYTEYIYINNTWEVLGSQQIDLTDYVKSEDVSTEIEAALAEAKASGEFDGADGQNGADGVSVTHEWEGTVLKVTSASGTSSVNLKGEKGDIGPEGPQGEKGEKGDIGPEGPQGEKGEKGDTGVQGIQGEQGIQGIQGESGKDGTSVTVTKVSESAADGGSNIVTFSDGKTLTVKNGSKGSKGDKGDTGASGASGKDGSDGADGVGIKSVVQTTTSSADGGSNIITVTKTDNTTSTFTVKNGSKGSKGDKGDTGSKGADGHTPVKGTDYFTEADKTEMVEKVATSLEGIPDYWKSALDEGVQAINTAIESAGANKSSFLFYTDAHWGYGSAMSPKLLKYLYENTAINKVNFGGDYMNSYNIAEDEYLAVMRSWKRAVRNLPNHHSVIGNHDYYDAYIPELESDAQQYGFLLAPEETNDVIRGNYFHYYIDNYPEKTRYIYLDTGLLSVSDESTQFTIDALNNTPEGWHIVIISHVWFVYNSTDTPTVGSVPAYCQKLLALFDAYNSRSSGSVTMNSNAISYDFSGSEGWVEFCIGGHIHVDYDFTSNNGIPIILTQTDSYHCRGDYTATAGTITEASVSAIIADYDAHKITVVRVGRGEGREVPITVYEVSYTNVLPQATDKDGVSVYNGIGYKADTRWSSSSNAETTGAGVYITGYIPVSKGDTVYLKNITMDKDINGNGCRLITFTDLNTRLGIYNADNLTSWCKATWDANGLLMSFVIEDGITYIRLQADYIGPDSIITINEPIEEK